MSTAQTLYSGPVSTNFHRELYSRDDYDIFKDKSTVNKVTKPKPLNDFDWVQYAN